MWNRPSQPAMPLLVGTTVWPRAAYPRSVVRPPGTGLRNVRGLLRKPEASLLVQKMQTGELKPGGQPWVMDWWAALST